MRETPTIGGLTIQKLRIALFDLQCSELARSITEAELKDIRETVMLITQIADDIIPKGKKT